MDGIASLGEGGENAVVLLNRRVIQLNVALCTTRV